MTKILYIASLANNRNRLDGETIKNRVLRDYLLKQNSINMKIVDTDNFRKKPIRIALKILCFLPWCDKIILSCSDQGAHIVLKFLRRICFKKKIFYFVIGGRLAKRIKTNRWSLKDYEKIDDIYVESKILGDELKELGLKNVEVVRNFRKVNKFNKKENKSDKIKFVFYGRVMKEKGVEKAIKLVEDLNEKGIDCRLDIYGQVETKYLEQLESSFNSYIKYVGEIKPDGMTEYEILSAYDIFLFPTEYPGECMPGSIIDARIAGLAILASKWKYVKEFIEDGEDGLIFNYGDYNDMFEKTLIMLKNDRFKKMKIESKKRAEEYLVEKVLIKPIVKIGEA